MRSAATLGSSIAAARRRGRPGRSGGRLQVHATIAMVSFVCYILGRLLDGRASLPFSMIGVGACGWAWLAARALFDPADRDARWPRVVALTVAFSGAISAVTPASGPVGRVVENVYALSGSAALLLTFVEPLQRYTRDLTVAEKRFRALFVAIYALLVAVSVLGLRAVGEGPDEVLRDNLVKSACAFVGLGTLMGAVWFRGRHPLARAGVTARRAPTVDDWRLAERLRGLLAKEAIESQADLRIGDVAARLGEPEYRVSQCISAALGFANFNRWINHHRIARAKDLLARPDEQRSILEIAFMCGFSSLGPFNRAFRDEVGMTPRAYRATMRGAGV